MKKPPLKILIISCLSAAVLTVAILCAVSAYSKSIVNSRDNTPDYVRYQSEGYSFDTVSNKRNILFCIYDEELLRCHIFTVDEDKHTLDILDIPPSTYISCDGFEGSIAEAYDLPMFTDIISRFMMLKTDSYAYISLEDFSALCKLMEVSAKARVISNSDAYVEADERDIKAYYSVLSKLIIRMDSMGAVDATAKLIPILINGLKTDLKISDMIDLASIFGEISARDTRLHLLPGIPKRAGERRYYFPDAEKTSKLLNDSFRVKGNDVSPDKLGINQTFEALSEMDIPQNILDY